jgi:PAS domain S-box-containing protein
MKEEGPTREELVLTNIALEERLREAEQLIEAIRNGEVDALVIDKAGGEQLYTLTGADQGYRVLVESINEGALILASDDSIYYCNRCFGEMLQLPIQRIIGTTLDSHVAPEVRPGLLELLRESRSCGGARGEFTLKRDDRTFLPVSLSLNCVNLENLQGVCAIVTDLSLQKTIEEELRRSNKELEEFAFIASHDLQEPLRKIQTFGDMIEVKYGGSMTGDALDYLRRMRHSAKRMRTFIQDLLDYSRLSTKGEPFSKVNLAALASDVVAELELRIEQTGGSVEVGDLPEIEADPSQMRQLFFNLIGNALKFHSEDKPHVRIHGQVQNPHICRVFVEDNGIGFEEKYLDRMFMPFRRLHGQGTYEGSGIGLSICRKIVERHGGSITARSSPGKGSTFIADLPIIQSRTK